MKIDTYRDNAIFEYKTGETLKQLGKKYGCNAETVKRRFVEWGIEIKNRGWNMIGKEKLPEHKQKLIDHLNRIRPLAIIASKDGNGKRFKGSNNPKWKGGVSTQYFKQKVLARDGRVCQICGYKEHPEIIEVHHIDSNHSNNVLENGIAVCPNCHRIEEFKRNTFHTKLRPKRYAN